MTKFEQFGQADEVEIPNDPERSPESREDFGNKTLEAAQEIYEQEVENLDKVGRK